MQADYKLGVRTLATEAPAGNVWVVSIVELAVQGTMRGNPSKSRIKLGWQQHTTISLLVNEMVDADLAIALDADNMTHH